MELPQAVDKPASLSLALLPTRFHLLERFSDKIAQQLPTSVPRIWIKRDDLSACAASGNKIRKLEYIFAEAQRQNCDTVISCGGLQSNHCRSTAILAAQLGFKCRLLLRGEQPDALTGNTLLDGLAGAEVFYYPAAQYQAELSCLLQSHQQQLAEQGHKALIIPTGASDGIGIWGYIQAAYELQKDFKQQGINPAAIVHATGSGGTQAGLILGAHLAQLHCPIYSVNVCDDAAYFEKKVMSDWLDWQRLYDPKTTVNLTELQTHIIEGYVGKGYGVADKPIFSLIAELAAMEGVVLDPVYSAKAFYGLVEEIKKGRFKDAKDVVFLHTGGIFSLFAYENQLNQQLDQR